mmetsp:Transcript_17493/g.48802  ORF Transcript_17493/g.48802 Transcript_17493/m.48802 type:complete len:1525 (-) Transcript_17493:573-5147(-)
MGCVKSKPQTGAKTGNATGLSSLQPERRPTDTSHSSAGERPNASIPPAGEVEVPSKAEPKLAPQPVPAPPSTAGAAEGANPPLSDSRAIAYSERESWQESLSLDSTNGVAKAHSSDFFADSSSQQAPNSQRTSICSNPKTSIDEQICPSNALPTATPGAQDGRGYKKSCLSNETVDLTDMIVNFEPTADRPIPEAVFGHLKSNCGNMWKDQKKRRSMHVATYDEDQGGDAPSMAAEAFHNARRSMEMRRASVGHPRAPILLAAPEAEDPAPSKTPTHSETLEVACSPGPVAPFPRRRRRSLANRTEAEAAASDSRHSMPSTPADAAAKEEERRASTSAIPPPASEEPPQTAEGVASGSGRRRRSSLVKPHLAEAVAPGSPGGPPAPQEAFAAETASAAQEGGASEALKNLKKRCNSMQARGADEVLPEGQTKAAREFHKARGSLEFAQRPPGASVPILGFAKAPREEGTSAAARKQQQQAAAESVPDSIHQAIKKAREEVDMALSEKALKLNTVPAELCKPLLLLSVLPVDTPAPTAMLQRLWADHVSVENIPRMVEELEVEGYIVSARPTEDSLWLLLDGSVQDSLQLAVGDLLPELHSFLLQSYIPPGMNPADVPDDGYFMHNVTYHLSEAGKMAELKQLLSDPFWLEEKLHSYGVASTVVDFRRFLMNKSDPEVRLLLQAFQMSVGSCLKHIDACILPSQMASRLLVAKDHYPSIPALVSDLISSYSQGKSGGPRSSTAGHRSRKTRFLRKKGGDDAFGGTTATRPSTGERRVSNVSMKSCRDSAGSRNSNSYTPVRCMLPTTATLEQAGQGSRMTLRGHSGAITCMELSPDAMDLVTSSADGSTCVWDTEIGDCVLLLEGEAHVTCIGLALNAGMVLTGTKLGTIQVWDLEGGVCRKTLRPHRAAVTCLKVAPNGSLVVSGSANGSVGVWALSSDYIMHHMTGHTAEILAMDAVFNVPWTSDHCQTLTGSSDFTARLWDLRSGKSRAVFEGHTGWVISVALTPDGELAVTGSNDHSCRVFDCANSECLFTLTGHLGPVNAVAVSNEKLATASDDHTIRIWDIDTGEALHALSGHNGWLTTTAIVDDVCIAAGSDCNLSVWDAASGSLKAILEGHSEEVTMCQLSSNAQVSVTISADNSARVWDLESAGTEQKGSQVPARHSGRVTRLVACQDGTVASAGEDGRAYVWNVEDGSLRAVLDEHVAAIKWLVCAANGSRIITVSGDRMICIWEMANLSIPVQTLPIERGSRVKSFAASADGKVGAVVLFDSSISILNLQTREVITMLQRRGDRDKEFVHSGGINGVVMSEDGQIVVTYSKDMTARVWDVTAGCCKVVLEGHTEDVLCATLSLDKSVVVTASYDGTARVWSTATGKCIALLPGHGRDVHSVVLSPDGSMVVTLAGQLTKVWETETGSQLYSLSHGMDEDLDILPMAVFNEAGTHMITAVEDRANVWDLKSGNLESVFVVDCTITSAVFSGPPGSSHSGIVVGDVNGNVHFARMPDVCQQRSSVEMFWETHGMAL